MPVFHACSHHASSTDRGARALQRLVEQVSALGARPMAQEGFEGFEREAHELFAEAEREVLGEALERLDADLAHVEIEGQRHHRVLDSAHRYTTAVGGVQARRTLYRCAGERAVSPMELRAGIVEGHWTPLAAREASRVVAQMTPQQGELREPGQHGALEELSGPLAQGAECALGGDGSGGVARWQ